MGCIKNKKGKCTRTCGKCVAKRAKADADIAGKGKKKHKGKGKGKRHKGLKKNKQLTVALATVGVPLVLSATSVVPAHSSPEVPLTCAGCEQAEGRIVWQPEF